MSRSELRFTPPASLPSRAAARRRGATSLPLLLGLVAGIVFFAVNGAIVYWKIQTLRENTGSVTRTHDVITTLEQLLSLMKDAETGQRGYLLTEDDRYLEPYTEAISLIDSRVAALEALVSDNPMQRERLPALRGLIEAKRRELALTIETRRTAGVEAARRIVLSDEGKTSMDQLRRHVEAMDQTERELRRLRLDETKAAFRTAVWSGILVSAIGALLSVVIASQVRRASRGAQRRQWLQEGQLQLARQLVGDPKLSELGHQSLRFLCDYLRAQAGVFYIEDAAGAGYRRAAAYAVPPESAPERFLAGEGLLGQAAREARSFVVENVPEGYLTIGSALGQHTPRHLLVFPVATEGRVNAVLELGFFQPVPEATLELLERVGEPIGVAVRAANYRTRVQDLLEETQRQTEELQAQSEELRVSNEELEEQSRALKESQTNLEEQQAALEQTNARLSEQTELLEGQKESLHRAKIALEGQTRAVEQASRYKSDFLANMSHELRTPLNSSLILAKLLADNREGNLNPEQVKYAQTIQAAGNDLLALINDVLDLSKVESGHMMLKPEPVALTRLVDDLRGIFEPLAAQKRLTLRFDLAPDAPESLRTDGQRLEQVLKNLIANALKFTERGEVALEIARRGADRLAFAVRDTGIGIAPDQQQIIFEPFRQGDSATNRSYGGTGLGLSISRQLVQLMGGEILLTSTPGRGSTFTVVVPETYAPPAEEPGGAKEVSNRGAPPAPVSAQPALRDNGKPSAPAARIPDDRERLQGHGRVILIVEDDEPFVRIVADLAHELSFQCLIATTAEEALTLARQFGPSAIVLDVGLPDNSGLAVLETLKSDARTRHIPVHVVSASDYSEKALSLGAIGYLLKPVKREQLAESFRQLQARLTRKMRRVLLVEDDATQLESLQALLASHEVEAVGAQTASETLAKLKNATFDCMVLDLTLPDASGFSLRETLMADDAYAFPPVIIYTGRDLGPAEEQRLRKYSKSIIIKGAKSPERLLDEVTLFLHQVVSDLPPEQQRLLAKVRNRETALQGRRVLIVEDDVRNIFALSSVLEPHGLALEIARNGREALAALERSAQPGAPASTSSSWI